MRKVIVLVLLMTLVGLHSVPAAAQSCPDALAPRLSVGRQAHVTPGQSNNLRDQPGTASQVVTKVPVNSYLDVLGGPQCADNSLWWQVSDGAETGWMAESVGQNYILEPTTTSTAQFTVPDDGKTVDAQFGNVEFTYNGVFGKSIQAAMLLPVPADPNNPLLQPASASINFIALPAEGLTESYFGVSISVYPVSDFEKANDYVKDSIPKLAAFLASKPQQPTDDQFVPAMPPVNAGEAFHSNIKYLSFDQGSGVRYLTKFAQDVSPITNDRLVYIFQGLSTDQHYLVTAYVPIKSKVLPDTYDDAKDFPDVSGDNAADLYQQYLTKTVASLNKSPDTDFTPSLEQIDAVLQSIKVK